MSTEQNKVQARRFLDEIMHKGDVAKIDELTADHFVDHQAPPGVPPTREGVKGFVKAFRTAFPDLHYTAHDVIAEGDRVVTRATATGTMKGEFQGMKPSGKSATWEEIHITRFENGKAVEHWGVTDQMGMFAQLGFVEAPGQPAAARR
jgi:predicted ester cyclase